MKTYFFYLFMFATIYGYSQSSKIDTLSFDISRGLLVIEGKINAIPTKFAFDTGASLGVTTNSMVLKLKIKKTGNSVVVLDGNNKEKGGSFGTIDTLSIGAFFAKNIPVVLVESMPLLDCYNYFLLGGDVINFLHWKFDFINKKVFISATAFSKNTDDEVIKFKTKTNRHFTTLYVNGKKAKNVLIDFGFNGFIELDTEGKIFKHLKKTTAKEQIISGFSTSMALVSVEKNENIFFKTKRLSFHKKTKALQNRIIDTEATDTKIGLKFFSSTCDELIINPVEKTYSLRYKNNVDAIEKSIVGRSASILLQNEKLIVASILSIDGINLEIGEEIVSVNGRNAASFANFCDYLDFMLNTKDDELEVVKRNGDTVVLKKIML